MDTAKVTVNGRQIALDSIATSTTVLEFLREQSLTACKEGCAEGECGACAVLVARTGSQRRASGSRSTPASCRSPRSTARSS